MSEHKFRCGDVAHIEGTDYDIEVAYADPNGYASWCGWPNGVVEISKLTLVKACSDNEHRVAVARWLDGPRSNDSDGDGRRNKIEFLYRPRAYWKRRLKYAQDEARIANALVEECGNHLALAFAESPADVAPLDAARVSEEGS